MPSTAAQDEFDALFNSSKETSLPHPEDLAADNESLHSSRSSQGGASSKDLEKKPLRSTTHPDSDLGDSDLETSEPRKSGKMRTRYYIPTTRSEANTGPKGVIADAQAFEQARRAHRGTNARSQKMFMPNPPPSSSNASSYPNHPYRLGNQYAGSWLMEPDEDDGDSEDDFLTRWRQSRLKELTKQHSRPNYIGGRSTNGPEYGTMQNVDADGYLDAIEQAQPDATVIVFIYDDLSDVSLLIEHCVHSIARAFPTIRFVKLHYDQAQMEPAGVPAILAYRGGDKFADMVPVLDEIPDEDELSAESLAIAMRKKGILP